MSRKAKEAWEVPRDLLMGRYPPFVTGGALPRGHVPVFVFHSLEPESFARIPRQDELELTPGAAYVHFTSNNTIFGTEWKAEPAVGDVPLVCDASSDIFSRPLDVGRYGLIYGGAQKNLGPSGLTVVVVGVGHLVGPGGLPAMLRARGFKVEGP